LDISNGKKRLDRRAAIAGSAALLSFPFSQPPLSNAVEPRNNKSGNNVYPSLQVVTDPETYSALSYAPPNNANNTPLIVVLHGAGKNDKDILQDLGDPLGEHAGLIPSLIASGSAPSNLLDNFCVLAPYSSGKASFYNDPRRNLLQFVEWAIANQNTEWLPLRFDPEKIVLFGFSDGATVAIELLTTRRFSAGVICSYGYSGMSLPAQALERLTNLPIWVFHSRDDVIFDVGNSDRLVQQLKRANTNNGGSANNDASSRIKYSRFDSDPENLPPRVRGHSMGITASKSTELYDWMMGQVN
jgi:predicted esterase